MVWITRTLSLIILSEAFAIIILIFAYMIVALWGEIKHERQSLKKPEEVEKS